MLGSPRSLLPGTLLPPSCFSFQRSRSTGTLAGEASDFIKRTAEQSPSRAPGRSGVGLVPASLRHKRPVLVLSLPPTGPSVPQSPFPKCKKRDRMVLCPPRALPVQDSIPSLRNLCPWTPALGREYRGRAPPTPFVAIATGSGWSLAQHNGIHRGCMQG